MSLREEARASATVLLVVLLALACATPAPLGRAARVARSHSDLEMMFAGQPAVAGPLGLYDAMARAVRHNLDRRVQLLEHSLAERSLTSARLDLLPRLLANDEYYGRDSVQAARSRSVLTGLESLEPSTSSDRYGWRNDLTLAWNLLDFGVSWVRAQQAAEEVQISAERRSKVVQDIAAETRAAWWRAAGADKLLPEVQELMDEVRGAIERAERLDDEGLVDPVSSLSYRRALLDKLRELSGLSRELDLARVELARLMNVRPGSGFALAAPDLDELQASDPDLPLHQLEVDALSQRPELREQDHRLRIQRLEVRRAMLSVLPGIELRVGRNHDTNEFLNQDDWFSYSALLTKNLVEIVTAPHEIGSARGEVDLADARRLALAMSVLAQVHVAARNVYAAHHELGLVQEVRRVELRLEGVTQARVEAERESELEGIRRRTDRVLADLRTWLAWSDLQAATGRLHAAVGADPLQGRSPGELPDLEALTTALRQSEDRWRRRIDIARDYPGASIHDAPLPAVSGAP